MHPRTDVRIRGFFTAVMTVSLFFCPLHARGMTIDVCMMMAIARACTRQYGVHARDIATVSTSDITRLHGQCHGRECAMTA